MAERRQVIVDLITRTKGGTKGIQNLKKDLGGVDSSAGKASTSVKGLGKTGAGATKGLKGLTSGLGASRFAMAGVAGGALAVGAVVKGSVQAFASFDDKMVQSQAIMGDLTQNQMDAMEQKARDVAKTTRISADEAAESYFFLASAGLDAEASIGALPKVAAFAQAGMFDMATATDLLTDAQSALGLTSDDAQTNMVNMTKVSDIFVRSNQLANTSVQQVSEAITNKLGGSLRAYNIDLEEGVAVLAAYADQGLKGASAGESFNIVLRDLKRSASDNASAFKDAGIEVFDSSGNFRNMADIVQDLEGAFGGLSVAQQTQLASDLGFQDRSFKNIQLLLGTSDAIRGYEGDLRNAGGATAEVAGNQLKSFSGQMDLIKSRVKDVGIGLGESLAPGVLSAAEGFAEFVESIAPAIEGLGMLLGLVGEFIGFVGQGINSIRSFFDPAVKASLRLEEAVQGVTDAGEDGQDIYDAFANGVQHLAQSGALTTDSLMELATAAGVTTESMGGALATNLEYARANGFAADQIAVMEQALRDSIEASDLDADAKRRLAEKYGLVSSQAEDADRKFRSAAEASGEAGDAAEDQAAELSGLEAALAAAEDAQTSLSDAMRAFADPVFAAAQAMRDLQEAEENLIEVSADVEASAEDIADAELEVFDATLKAQGALDAFDGSGIEGQITIIQDVLGKSREGAILFLESLGLLDGTQVGVGVNAVYTASGTAPPGLSGTSAFLQATGSPRAGGGPVTKNDPFFVGEKGPELFVPDSNGMIVPNDMIGSGGTTNNEKTVNINFVNPNLANDPVKAIRSKFASDSLAGNI